MLKFNLVDNALDSLEHAIGHITGKKTLVIGDYKRIIQDLAHVSELLLKERLRMIHPAFLFSNVDKFPSKDAHTVSAEQALERLKTIGDIIFEKEDHSALENIRKKRNEITHFEFSLNEDEARIIIGSILVFIFRFSCDEIGLDWADRRLTDPSWNKLREYAEFYKAQLKLILDTIDNGQIPTMECPTCHNETFDLEAEICLLCGHKEDVLECKRCKSSYMDSMIKYEEAELCPECEWKDDYVFGSFILWRMLS
jgi:hypothetical protein